MTSLQDTAYPRLNHQLTTKALIAVYTPSDEELVLADGITRSRVANVGFLVLLKTYQRLGYPVLMKDVPASIIRQISTMVADTVSAEALDNYDRSGSRRRHLKVVRDYLELTAYGEAAQRVMVEAMTTAAQTKHDLADLINVAIEELVKAKFELPAFSTLVRQAFQVRAAATQGFYEQVYKALNAEDYLKLNRLFIQEEGSSTTLWNRLKQEPGKPMLSHLNALVERLHWLQDWQMAASALKALPPVKLKQFAAESQTLSANQMREMAPHKRYTLAAALLSVQSARTLDDLAEMFIKRLRKMRHNAREALMNYRQETQKRTDTLVTTLREVIVAYQQEGPPANGWLELTSFWIIKPRPCWNIARPISPISTTTTCRPCTAFTKATEPPYFGSSRWCPCSPVPRINTWKWRFGLFSSIAPPAAPGWTFPPLRQTSQLRHPPLRPWICPGFRLNGGNW